MYTAGTKHVNPVGTPHRKRGDVLNNIHILLPVAEAIIWMPTLDMGGAWVIQTRAHISIGVHGYPCTQYNSPYMRVGTYVRSTLALPVHGYPCRDRYCCTPVRTCNTKIKYGLYRCTWYPRTWHLQNTWVHGYPCRACYRSI
jgi:hypothetical protein